MKRKFRNIQWEIGPSLEQKIRNEINNIGNKKSLVGNKNFCFVQGIPWQTKLSKSLSSVIRGFKIGVTKYFHKKPVRNNNHCFLSKTIWQKSYYDHIIRNEKSLFYIREYIQNNPLKWELEKDRNHLSNINL